MLIGPGSAVFDPFSTVPKRIYCSKTSISSPFWRPFQPLFPRPLRPSPSRPPRAVLCKVRTAISGWANVRFLPFYNYFETFSRVGQLWITSARILIQYLLNGNVFYCLEPVGSFSTGGKQLRLKSVNYESEKPSTSGFRSLPLSILP